MREIQMLDCIPLVGVEIFAWNQWPVKDVSWVFIQLLKTIQETSYYE